MRKKAASLLASTLILAVALSPGCILGSPVAAFSGEPYGMTRDDWRAIGGERGQLIWGGHPVLAGIDLPFAFVLDTGFLPIALIMWGVVALADAGDDHGHDHDEGDDHDHEHDDDHEHEGDADHDHRPDDDVRTPPAPARDPLEHAHGDYRHSHEGGDRPHSH